MKKIVILFLAFLAAVFLARSQRLAGFWYLPTMSVEQATSMANFDVVVVDVENIFNNPQSLEIMKQLHPDIKLLAYLNPVEVFDPPISDKPWSNHLLGELKNHPGWWLKGDDGRNLVFWPGMRMLDCRWPQGQAYLYFLASSFNQEVLASNYFDGVFIDNLWSKANWISGYGSSRLSVADAYPENFNRDWEAGLKYLLGLIRKSHPDYIFIANPGDKDYYHEVQGKQFEDFPNPDLGSIAAGGWYLNMSNAALFGRYNIFTARSDNSFFTLCSAMLLDNVFFSPPQNSIWKKDYQLDLGKPLDSVQKSGSNENLFFFRHFQNGLIQVWPEKNTSVILYNNGIKRYQ
jgi:endo-alpha-1,4-polygalactosaminidase (GH114 family)